MIWGKLSNDVIKFRKIAVLISKSTKINLSNKHVVFIRTINVRKLFSEIASIIYKNSINEKVALPVQMEKQV